jgi:CDGSH-type Zn-finger protein
LLTGVELIMAKIKVTKNGPYVISKDLPINEDIVKYNDEGTPVKTEKGKTIPNESGCSLCRCGKSKNKPFCDGSHETANFNGTEVPQEKYEDMAETIEGPDLILKDAGSLCAGAGFCHRAGGVWELTDNSDDPASKKIAVEECHCCPSGRLVAVDKKTGKVLEEKLEESIGIPEDGPLCVKGEVEIESADGETYEKRNRVTLCRCGKSRNKPFCDGSHLD